MHRPSLTFDRHPGQFIVFTAQSFCRLQTCDDEMHRPSQTFIQTRSTDIRDSSVRLHHPHSRFVDYRLVMTKCTDRLYIQTRRHPGQFSSSSPPAQSLCRLQTCDDEMHRPSLHSNSFDRHPGQFSSSSPFAQSFCRLQTCDADMHRPSLHSNSFGRHPGQFVSSSPLGQSFWLLQTWMDKIQLPSLHVNSFVIQPWQFCSSSPPERHSAYCSV